MHLLIIGNGNFAQKLLRDLPEHNVSVTHGVPMEFVGDDEIVAVHVGSGRELPELLENCRKMGIPLIQAATKQFEGLADSGVVVIDAQNLALAMVALLKALVPLGGYMQALGASTSVTESHQSTKKTPPGTAIKIAAAFGNSRESVDSIRDQEVQVDGGVPEKYLAAHAYHFVKIRVDGMVIDISTKIHGRDVYVPGLVAVARRVLDNQSVLPIGVTSVEDLMFSGKFSSKIPVPV